MARLTPVTWRGLVGRLRELGFEGPLEGGKHPYMVKGELVITLPNPHRSDVSVALLKRILQQAGVSREEWQGGR